MVDLAGEPGQRQLYHSPIGVLLLEFAGQRLRRICRVRGRPAACGTVVSKPVVEALQAYFAGHHDALCRLPLVAAATTFQQRLRHALGQVQCGQVVSYGVLAARLHTAPRAVGRGCASNPLPLVVPCHRVVSADGQPGGFSLGVRRKRWLLRHEGVVL